MTADQRITVQLTMSLTVRVSEVGVPYVTLYPRKGLLPLLFEVIDVVRTFCLQFLFYIFIYVSVKAFCQLFFISFSITNTDGQTESSSLHLAYIKYFYLITRVTFVK